MTSDYPETCEDPRCSAGATVLVADTTALETTARCDEHSPDADDWRVRDLDELRQEGFA